MIHLIGTTSRNFLVTSRLEIQVSSSRSGPKPRFLPFFPPKTRPPLASLRPRSILLARCKECTEDGVSCRPANKRKVQGDFWHDFPHRIHPCNQHGGLPLLPPVDHCRTFQLSFRTAHSETTAHLHPSMKRQSFHITELVLVRAFTLHSPTCNVFAA